MKQKSDRNNLIKRLFKKLKGNKGFSLSELLITVAIMGFVSLIAAGGVAAAQRSYPKINDAANSQVAMSTAITLLRDELAMAKNVKASSTEITYETNGITCTITNGTLDGVANDIEGIIRTVGTGSNEKTNKLLSETATSGLIVKISDAAVSGSNLSLTVTVSKGSGENSQTLAAQEYVIHLLNS